MEQKQSVWQTEALTQKFLKGVRGAIPGADLQLKVLGKIVSEWVEDPKYILDLGCGNGILGKFILTIFPSAKALFIDFSDPMLEEAKKNLHTVQQATVIKADFSSPQWMDSIQSHYPVDIIVSGFAIHHQSDNRKQSLYSEIFSLLNDSGVFLNLEHVASKTISGEQLSDEFFIDQLEVFHKQSDPTANREEIAQTYFKRPDKKENILTSVDQQCQWLIDCGFTDVDCFFKLFEFALFGGRKID